MELLSIFNLLFINFLLIFKNKFYLFKPPTPTKKIISDIIIKFMYVNINICYILTMKIFFCNFVK